MSKNRFRYILLAPLALAVIGGIVDWLWPDPLMEKVSEYIWEIEPELDGAPLIATMALIAISSVLALVSFIGLLLFKAWARRWYVLSLLLTYATYPFFGLAVSGGYSQILYELSVLLSGVVLGLIYYSPVAKFYEHNT